MKRLLASALLLLASGCVSGSKIRADSEVIQVDVERARRNGALSCAPVELATAEAHLDFARGELSQGSSFRASEHIRTADDAVKKALALSKECGPKQVVVREKPEPTRPTDKPADKPTDKPTEVVVVKKPPPTQVVRIEEVDTDGDGILDRNDPCPDRPEDKDGFQDEDGCPELDNDNDGVVDTGDKCPLIPGVPNNQGCPEEKPKDRDGDGIVDSEDKCADQAEDKDGFQDEDGCPELDNDTDGIIDSADKCPSEPGPLQNLGCPITDRDGDGVKDELDKCPGEPEDKDGFEDDDGCPDLDNDKDGIPDVQDRCPDKAGPSENSGCPDIDSDGDSIVDRLDRCPTQGGPVETVGCPDTDGDKDGLVDRLDRCPEQAGPTETGGCPDPDADNDGIADRLDACPDERGIKEEKGCPKKYKLVVVKRDKIEIKKQINFRSGSARIVGRQSFYILDDVAAALRDAAFIKKVRIEGHTDSAGSDAANLRLSQNRADAVMAELIKRGIDPTRLISVGYGEAEPIAPNTTARGRAQNRRTEFDIVEQ